MATPFVDMEMDDDEKLDASMPIPMPDKPEYPYGLRICLNGSELKKLDLDPTDAFIGGIIHGHFLGTITSASQQIGEGYENCRVEIQITALSIESEDEENDEDGDY